LDSKDPKDQEIINSAPPLQDYLSAESGRQFQEVLALLAALDIPFTVNHRLVRGLDYYTSTIFEFVTEDNQALLAGGRYDSLIKALGGPDLPGIGWAAGVERLCLYLDQALLPPLKQPVAIVRVDTAIDAPQSLDAYVLKVATLLRRHGHKVVHASGMGGSPSKQLSRVLKRGAWAAIFLGEAEMKGEAVTTKCLRTGRQTNFRLSELPTRLYDLLEEKIRPEGD